MDIIALKQMSFEEVRQLYLSFLHQQNISKNTIQTAYSDSFYLWRKGNHDLFWKAVEARDEDAKNLLLETLKRNSSADPQKVINGYLSHIRRFQQFLKWDELGKNEGRPVLTVHSVSTESTASTPPNSLNFRVAQNKRVLKSAVKDIPEPSEAQVEFYLSRWNELENYRLQEQALNKLFFELCPENTDIEDILLKVSTLNDFYSTNIFSVYPVARHIQSLNIDARLKSGDISLVNDIKQISIGGKIKNFYSFASKYCSHHNPKDFPIYDSYVDAVLRYYRDKDNFASFKNDDLKDYIHFKGALNNFRKFYGLEKYDLKQLDVYLWQLGKDYFPKKY